MYRQTPRNVALSASSAEFGYSNKLKTPSSLKKDTRSQIRSIDSWMTVDQNEAYVGNKNALKSTDTQQRPALGLVSNKLGDRNNSSLPVFKKHTVSMPEFSKEKEFVFATPAPKKNPGRWSHCTNLDYTLLPKYSEISQLSNTLQKHSIQIEYGSVCSTDEEYEDVFSHSQDSPAPDSDYLSQPEVLRRFVSCQNQNYDCGDDFTQLFITETDTDHEGLNTPEIMYHPASPDTFEPYYSDYEIFLMETMIRSDPEAPPPPPPEPMSFPARNWWDELKPEPTPDFNETMEDADSDLGSEFNCSGSDEECCDNDRNSETNQTILT